MVDNKATSWVALHWLPQRVSGFFVAQQAWSQPRVAAMAVGAMLTFLMLLWLWARYAARLFLWVMAWAEWL